MKTERFDEEFRRKLLGLPADADPGEVERIHGYVRANQPALVGLSWGKLLLYGGSCLLLLGSLSYNLIQHYRNTHLQASVESLAHRSARRATASEVIRHDTIYIIQSGITGKVSAASPVTAPQTLDNPPEVTRPTQPGGIRRVNPIAIGRPSVVQSSRDKATPSQPDAGSSRTPLTTNMPATATSALAFPPPPAQPGSLHTETPEAGVSLPSGSPERLALGNDKLATSEDLTVPPARAGINRLDNDPPNAGLPSSGRRDIRSRKTSHQPKPFKTSAEPPATAHPDNPTQPSAPSPSVAGLTPLPTETVHPGESVSAPTRPPVSIESLGSRQPRSGLTQLTVLLPGPSLTVPHYARPDRTMPGQSTARVEYRLGGGFSAGSSDQWGGALLGEVLLNRHWSLQAGLRLLAIEGFHYRDDQEFNDHQPGDFRQLYAPRIAQSTAIQDIRQLSLLAQVPLQVAYHPPLGGRWGLRLGLGTDLDIWGLSRVSYAYRESSRSAEHGQSSATESVRILNNVTLSTAVERSWKKWLVRAGPFVSPQLRPVSYKPEEVNWGVNLQVLYRLSK